MSPDAQGDASGHRLRRGCLDVTALFPGVPAGAKQSRHAGATWPPCRGRSLARSSAPREVALEVGNVLLNVLVVLVAAKLEFDGGLSTRELADVINEVEASVRKEVPQARVIYLEPDVVRSG